MEEDGHGGGGAHHRSDEAISAVGFLSEEGIEDEDDDYEDLYNDVNVGEGFLQSLSKSNHPHVPEQSQLGFSDLRVSDRSNNNEEFSGTRVVEEKVSKVESVPGEGSSGGGARVEAGGFGSGGLRVQLGQSVSRVSEVVEKVPDGNSNVANVGNVGNVVNNDSVGYGGSVQGSVGQQMLGGGGVGGGRSVPSENLVGRGVNGGGGNAVVNVGGGGGGGGGGTILFVGDLHWWTTDAELESELCKYGAVKEVRFFDEKASGKSKGYCQVEFHDPAAAAACKDGMNGHVFNGRACVVAFASPYTVKKMGEAQVNRNQQIGQTAGTQARRGPVDGGPKTGGPTGPAATGNAIATGGNYQGGDGNNRGYGRGNWGRGNAQGMGNRGPIGPMRGRAGGGMGFGGRGIMGNTGNGFGQGMGATPPLLHPNSMMGQGFDPAFGGPMGRMGSYGGFPGAPTPPFSGMMPSFPPMGGVGLPGVAPHVNPAFFGRGMPMSSMGMMPTSGVDGPNMGMWNDPSMGGWAGDEHGGGRAGESSYGEEAASDHQYGDGSHDRGGYPTKDKDRALERDWSGSSDRRYRDDREMGYDRDMPREKDAGGHDHDWQERRHRDDGDDGRDRERGRDRDRERSKDRDHERARERDRDRDRDRYREDRDRYTDHHRYRDREVEHDEDWDRARSSKSHSKSRLSHDDDHRSRSRDPDYGKRRRLTSD